jgi:hypothetical protein
MTRENLDRAIADRPVDRDSSQNDWLQNLIIATEELPAQVRRANLTRIDERVIDRSLIDKMSEQAAFEGGGDSINKKLERRVAALSPFAGKKLICVSIHLPGVSYTIEVDPERERVVHWEWRAM